VVCLICDKLLSVSHFPGWVFVSWFVVQSGAHLGGSGRHGRPLCTAGRLLSIKADNKTSNAVTEGL